MTELECKTLASLPAAPGDAFALTTPLPLSQHPAEVYLARLAPGSRRTMRGALNTLASALGVPAVFEQDAAGQQREVTYRFCRWEQLRYQHTAALRSLLAEQYTAATANKILAALRGVLKEAWQLGFMTSEDYHRARNVQNIKDTTLLRGLALKPGESIAIQAACADDDRLAAVRDAALLAVMQGAGLRRSEAGSLFCRTRKGNTVVRERLSAQAVYKTVQRRATAAHVPEITPHDLRRTFISNLLDAGVDLSTSSELAGHSDPRTTKRYDRRGEATRKQAVDKLHVPYVPHKKH